MLIRYIKKLPRKCAIACSGGVDSMAVLDFLSCAPKREIDVLYFNHNTDHGDLAEKFVRDYCNKNNLNLIVGRTDLKPESNREMVWRDERYKFLNSYDGPVITCHHLDDSLETYLFTSFRGFPKIIPYQTKNVIRPFLTTEKIGFIKWCENRGVPYINDDSNDSMDFSRNRIRHKIVPEVMLVNPGIKKVIKKKILEL